MRQTWRWFGPKDLVSIDDVREAGAEGVVTALHHLPPGQVWSRDEIARRKDEVARRRDGRASGLTWDVVESLPVSEAVKTAAPDRAAHIAAWTDSLRNLAAEGIEVVCYNFMPVLDWTRTDLAYEVASGATCMRFDLIDFAAFDLFVLERPGAGDDYDAGLRAAAKARADAMDAEAREAIARNIVFGLPGAADNFTLPDVRARLNDYAAIGADELRANLIDFLSQVAPVAEELGLRLCCHPDDPPFPLLGLPRIMSTESDYARVMQAVPERASGITLCTGSLGARPDNDLPGMIDRLGDRVHFLHLRNVTRESDAIRGSFYEAEHLGGDTDMVAVIAATLREERRRRDAGRPDASIPFRPDHGQDILDDKTRKAQPGYPAIGRLKGLAELRGVIAGLGHAGGGQ
ncbi:mannonate dehydratase [Mesobaculum littorinae]|uniref:Mannonate dehydratase n=1 Tax=Mesobaculum littorinae TaxID=2486419 RepID=A0A438AI11_9RHOB|nr:mannonate dehydratase [Mesobaculum littorinae]RVV98294.1 mannonate dehydratase [Mesobaculum littorinae]